MNTLTAWLESSLARHANRPALKCGERVCTYRELEEKSRALAARLLAMGASRGERVAVHLEKSIDAVISLFAVLRAGAAYAPIDVRLPEARKRKLLEALRCRIAIDEGLTPSPDMPGCRPLRLEPSLWSLPPDPAILSGAPRPHEGDPAYFLFTSGSTADPKVIEISQGAALAFAAWAAKYFALSPADSIANTSGFHFDLSTLDLFSGLGSGARVVLAPSNVGVFPRTLAELLSHEKISLWYTVPSTLKLLARAAEAAPLPPLFLRALLLAGDVFPAQAVAHLLRSSNLERCRVFNLYGPAETNVCTVYELPRPLDGIEAPIGRPIAGVAYEILNESGARVSAGEVGELIVWTPCAMTGASAFPPDPQGRRSHRTGDLVHEDPASGLLYFHGRRDLQVKSYGYRVNPVELECTLLSFPEVLDCCALAEPDATAGSVLHAFVVLKTPHSITAEALQARISQLLPTHYWPAKIELRERLAYNQNGKVDRRSILEGLS